MANSSVWHQYQSQGDNVYKLIKDPSRGIKKNLFWTRLSSVVVISFFKGALYVIEPSTRNGKMWPTRDEAAPSVPKNILWYLNQTWTRTSLFQSITDVSTTTLSRITFKSRELKIATTVITRHACLVSCRSFVHRSAAQHCQDIFRCCLSRVGQILPLRVEGSNPIQCPFKLLSALMPENRLFLLVAESRRQQTIVVGLAGVSINVSL